MKSNTKRKIEPADRMSVGKSKAGAKTKATKSRALNADSIKRAGDTTKKIDQTWSEEVKTLVAARYASVEEATRAIIRQVTDRMQSDGSSKEARRETSDFLKLLFETDPMLQAKIRGSLDIG